MSQTRGTFPELYTNLKTRKPLATIKPAAKPAKPPSRSPYTKRGA